jgi:hypothetical protein
MVVQLAQVCHDDSSGWAGTGNTELRLRAVARRWHGGCVGGHSISLVEGTKSSCVFSSIQITAARPQLVKLLLFDFPPSDRLEHISRSSTINYRLQ